MRQKHGSKAEKGGSEANIEGEAKGEENIEEEMEENYDGEGEENSEEEMEENYDGEGEENGDGEGEENIETEIVENIDIDPWEKWKKILDEKFVNILVQQLEKYVTVISYHDATSNCDILETRYLYSSH